LFAHSYADLYTRFCQAEIADLKDEIGDMVSKDEFNEHCIGLVSVKDVTEAVSRSKFGIHYGHSSLPTDHVKLACNEMFVYISMLLSALIVHGSITDDLPVTTILPTPKGKNLNYSCSANYRAIASSSIIGKILDALIGVVQKKTSARGKGRVHTFADNGGGGDERCGRPHYHRRCNNVFFWILMVTQVSSKINMLPY
jgi:hypothetical protein